MSWKDSRGLEIQKSLFCITFSKEAGLVAMDWPTLNSNHRTHSMELGIIRFGELFWKKNVWNLEISLNLLPHTQNKTIPLIYASTDFHRWLLISWRNIRAKCETNHCPLVAGPPSWPNFGLFCKEPLSRSPRPGLISHLAPNSARPRLKENTQPIQTDLCIHDGQVLMLLRGKCTRWGGSLSHELQSFRCSRSQNSQAYHSASRARDM